MENLYHHDRFAPKICFKIVPYIFHQVLNFTFLPLAISKLRQFHYLVAEKLLVLLEKKKQRDFQLESSKHKKYVQQQVGCCWVVLIML